MHRHHAHHAVGLARLALQLAIAGIEPGDKAARLGVALAA
jgi:hypothetical protein